MAGRQTGLPTEQMVTKRLVARMVGWLTKWIGFLR